MDNYYETFQISNDEIVIFTTTDFKGMVGENHSVTTAKLLNVETQNFKLLSYADLNKIYNGMQGRHPRIQFFYAKRPMSPKGIAEENDSARKQAIARVI